MAKGKHSLRDIIRQSPSEEEAKAVADQIIKITHHPIVVAVLGAAMIEHELESLLRPRFRRNDSKTWARLTGEYGPLGSLAQKIHAADAFALIDEPTRNALMLIKDVRNAFAHSKKLIDFSHESIIDEYRSLKIGPKRKTGYYLFLERVKNIKGNPRNLFVALCYATSTQLIKVEKKRLKAQRRTLKKRMNFKYNPLLAALLETTGQSLASLSQPSALTDSKSQGLGALDRLAPPNPDVLPIGLGLLSRTPLKK